MLIWQVRLVVLFQIPLLHLCTLLIEEISLPWWTIVASGQLTWFKVSLVTLSLLVTRCGELHSCLKFTAQLNHFCKCPIFGMWGKCLKKLCEFRLGFSHRNVLSHGDGWWLNITVPMFCSNCWLSHHLCVCRCKVIGFLARWDDHRLRDVRHRWRRNPWSMCADSSSSHKQTKPWTQAFKKSPQIM